MTNIYNYDFPYDNPTNEPDYDEQPETKTCYGCGLEVAISEGMIFDEGKGKTQLLCPDCVLDARKEGFNDNNFRQTL